VIPVYIEFDTTGQVHAECVKCGKCAHSAVRAKDGGPKTRQKAAADRAIAELATKCEERLSWGPVPVHRDRRIPRGIALYARDHTGRLWPLTVSDRGKLETVAGGCALTATVLVVPESEDYRAIARECVKQLIEGGYVKTQLEPPQEVKACSLPPS
jgi:hypothetical protein